MHRPLQVADLGGSGLFVPGLDPLLKSYGPRMEEMYEETEQLRKCDASSGGLCQRQREERFR